MCILGLSLVKNDHNSTVNATSSVSREGSARGEEMFADYAVAGLSTLFAMYAIFSALSILINAMLLVGAHRVSDTTV